MLERLPNGSLIARLHVSSLLGVKRWILWWGSDCEVVEPNELRDLIAGEVREMLDRHESTLERTLCP